MILCFTRMTGSSNLSILKKRRESYTMKLKHIDVTRILFPLLLFLFVIVFWQLLHSQVIHELPRYTGEMTALKSLNWGNMWGNVFLKQPSYWYYRISPTALFPLSLLDRDFLAPALGIHFPSQEFKYASRLVVEGIIGVACMSLAVYFLSISLGFSVFESFLAGLFVGVFKGISYFFSFASIVHVIPLLVIYSSMTILFFMKYLQSRKKKLLIGYYLFLLLAVGTWEQWINLLAFLLVFTIFYFVVTRKISLAIILNGLILPMTIFAGYMLVKYPTLKLEASNAGQEAEYVFSYPSRGLMIEDMISNASLHISDVIEPALFPWPMLSQSVIRGINPDELNTYNATIHSQKWSQAHYLAFTDWYAGVLFGLTLVFSVWLAIHIFKNPKEVFTAGTGLILLWTGFIAHLPIMYRALFIKPGWEGILGYKHMLSVVGAGILIAWIFSKIDQWLKRKFLTPPADKPGIYLATFYSCFLGIFLFLVMNNYVKIVITWFIRWRGLPW
jgi:hypothetical protein